MSKLKVPTVAEMIANNERPDILFWVGCSGSFDDRAKKITKAIVKILNYLEENNFESKKLIHQIVLSEPFRFRKNPIN